MPTEPSVVAAGLAAAGLAANGVCFLDVAATRRDCATDARRCGAVCSAGACGLMPSDDDRPVTVCWAQPASIAPANASRNNWAACLIAIGQPRAFLPRMGMPNRGRTWPDHGQNWGRGRIPVLVMFAPQRRPRFRAIRSISAQGRRSAGSQARVASAQHPSEITIARGFRPALHHTFIGK